MSTVSVVIPTFNREGFIKQCVVSALQQSKKPDEVIVVDDGSSDKTWDVLRTLGFSDSKEEKNSLRYIFQRNKGVSAARNLGIKASKFRYIAFLDSDDLWLEKKLEKQISSLESQSTRYRLSHTNEIWVRNGVRVNAIRPGFFPTEWNKKNFITKDREKKILGHTPMNRFGQPQELIGAILWLSSDASSFVTGAEITVDGGYSCMTI